MTDIAATRLLPLLFLLAASCAGEPPQSSRVPKPRVVSAEVVARRAFPRTYRASGTVRATRTATLSSKAVGSVRKVSVKAGDLVREGDVLVELEANDARAGVAGARAAVASATAGKLEAENALGRASVSARLHKTRHERSQALFEQKVIAQSEYDDAEASFASAAAEEQMARARLQAAASSLEQARAMLSETQAFLGYTQVVAPFSGRVLERLIDPGTLAASGTPLLVLSDDDRLRVEVAVSESQMPLLNLGDRASLQLQGYGGALEGVVSEIVPNVDVASRAFLVKLDLPRRITEVRPGTFARVEFDLGRERGLVVPTTAVSRLGALERVFVVESGKARLRMITSGEAAADVTQVLSGVSEGEHVVLSPSPELRDGSTVEVTP